MRARRRTPAMPNRAGLATLGALAAALAAASVFLPWYAPDVGPPFAPDSASGWDATIVARLVLVAALVAAGSALGVALDERGIADLGARVADALTWVLAVAAGIALALVLYRLLILPEPADFLSRRIGVYVSVATCAGALLSGLALLARRD